MVIMKVLHVITGLGVGGAERMLLNILPKLANRNIVVSLTDDNTVGNELEKAGITVHYLGLRRDLLNLVSVLSRFRSIIRREKPDCVNSYLIHANLFARVFARLFGVNKVICSVRNKHIHRPGLVLLDRLTSWLVDRYTPNSPVVSEFMTARGFRESKITVIPNGIDASLYLTTDTRSSTDPNGIDASLYLTTDTRSSTDPTSGEDLRETLGMKDRFCFLTVATLRKKKGHSCLIKAIARFIRIRHNTVFLFAGDGPERESLTSLATSLGCEDHVRFLGERDDVADLLQLCDAFVLPSRHEGMSNALLEAMASGTPVVCSDIEENRWVTGPAGLLAEAGSIESLCDCLLTIHSTPKLRKELSEAGLQRVRECFRLENTLRLYRELYRGKAAERITVITEYRRDAIDIYNKELIKRLADISGIEHIHINPRPFANRYLNYGPALWHLARLAVALPKRDVLLFTDPKTIKANAAFLLGNRKVCIIHHLDRDPWYYRPLPFINFTRLLKRFDRLICISGFTGKQVTDLGVPPERITVVRSGVDHQRFHPCEEKPDGWDETSPGRYILHVGTEIPRKNIDNLLRAFKLLLADGFHDVKLVKIGAPGKRGERKKTVELIEKLQLQDNVMLMDRIVGDDLSRFYSHAELLLFPSLLEGFGLPVVEAMACGCPVVTSDLDPMKELAGGTQLLADPHNPRDIADQCRRVLEDKALRVAMKQGGIKRAGEFTWEKTAKGIIKVLSEL